LREILILRMPGHTNLKQLTNGPKPDKLLGAPARYFWWSDAWRNIPWPTPW